MINPALTRIWKCFAQINIMLIFRFGNGSNPLAALHLSVDPPRLSATVSLRGSVRQSQQAPVSGERPEL